MTLSVKIYFFNKIGFNVFYVMIKTVPIVRNFKQTIYQTFK